MKRIYVHHSREIVNAVHTARDVGMTLAQIRKRYNLTLGQVHYILYTRRPAYSLKDLQSNAGENSTELYKAPSPSAVLTTMAQTQAGSAPPPKKGFWEKLKSVLGF